MRIVEQSIVICLPRSSTVCVSPQMLGVCGCELTVPEDHIQPSRAAEYDLVAPSAFQPVVDSGLRLVFAVFGDRTRSS